MEKTLSTLSTEEIAEILECLKGTDFTEVRLSYAGVELWVTRVPDGHSVRRLESWHEADPAASVRAVPAAPSANATPPATDAPTTTQPLAPATSGSDIDEGVESGITLVKSPMLGTFYIAPSPSDPPFVTVGDKVEADAVVGIVEAMKLMTQVHSGVTGEVVEVLVANEELVEFGQPLMKIRAS